MKKVLAIVLALMSVLFLTACGTTSAPPAAAPEATAIPKADEVLEEVEEQLVAALESVTATEESEPSLGLDISGFVGTKEIGDYSFELHGDHAVLKFASKFNPDVTIPAEVEGQPVTAIGDEAFQGAPTFVSITLPDTVTSIGGEAFRGCGDLASLTLPATVTSIGPWAFDGTPWFESLTDEFVIVGDGVLIKYNGAGGSVVVPSGVKAVSTAFAENGSITSVTLPDTVTSIAPNAFRSCKALTQITLPAALQTIGEAAFYRCEGLAEVAIPDSVTSIGYGAFQYCAGLTALTLPNSTEDALQDNAFAGCKSLASVAIPGTLKYLPNSLFRDCSSLVSITIPASVISIADYALPEIADLVVTCPAGSYAEQYAQERGIACVAQ